MTNQSDRLTNCYREMAEKSTDLFNKAAAMVQDPDFKCLLSIATNHGFTYKGPDIGPEMMALNASINALSRALETEEAEVQKEVKNSKLEVIELPTAERVLDKLV